MPIWSFNLNPLRLDADLDPAGLARATPGAFARLEALGATGVRIDLSWAALEPSPGVIVPGLLRWYRDFCAEANRRGIQVFALLYHPPGWAMALLPDGTRGSETRNDAFLEAWRGFCRVVAEDLGALLTLVQPWNEPNNFLAALKRDPVLFHTRRLGPVTLPVGVPWELLASLFKIAREEMPAHVSIVVNILANLCPFLPLRAGWLDWEHFTDELLARAGSAIDVVAIDHYPDTWAPGTGPHEWDCLAVARRKIADPASPWHGKRLALGETGYSSAPNFHLVNWPIKLARVFPGERGEDAMASWYAHALPRMAAELASTTDPAPWINLYELYDPLRALGGHPVLAIEDHFGLVRADGTPKPAFEVVKRAIAGTLDPHLAPWRVREPLYWRLARWSRKLEARLRPAPRVLERVVPRAHAPVGEPNPVG